jgi:hypothetical protein
MTLNAAVLRNATYFQPVAREIARCSIHVRRYLEERLLIC